MGIFLPKPPTAYCGRNKFAFCRTGRLVKSLGLYEGSGAPACTAPPRNGGPAGVAATLDGSAAWDTDANGPFVVATGASDGVTVWTNSSGVDYDLHEWTIAVTYAFPNDAAARQGVTFNSGTANEGAVAIRKLATNYEIRAQISIGGVIYYWSWSNSSPAVARNFVLRGDSRGFYAYMDGVLGTPGASAGTVMPNQLTDPRLRIANGNAIYLGRSSAAFGLSPYIGNLEVWRIGLEAAELQELFVDPFCCHRLRPSHLFADRCIPRQGKRGSDSVVLMAVTAQDLDGETAYFRARAGAAWSDLEGATPTAGDSSAAETTLLEETLTLPEDEDAVGLAEWSLDGSAWYAYPAGLMHFLHESNEILNVTDSHWNTTAEGMIPDNMGTDPDDVKYGEADFSLSAAARRTFTANLDTQFNACLMGPYAAVLVGGDIWFWDQDSTAGTDDFTVDKLTRTERTLDAMCHYSKQGPLIISTANHDGAGYQQDWFGRSMYKQAMYCWVTFGFNKNLFDNAMSDGHTDRLPALDSVGPNGTVYNAAWRTANMTAAHLTGAENLYGDVVFAAAGGATLRLALFDSESYSGVGVDTDVGPQDAPSRYALGARQKVQQAAWAAASTADWNIAAIHRPPTSSRTTPGGLIGTTYYARSARWLDASYFAALGVAPSPDYIWYDDLLASYFDAELSFHNHWNTSWRRRGVRRWQLGTSGAVSHAGDATNPAWNTEGMSDDVGLGTAQSLGLRRWDGSVNTPGHAWSANAIGFGILSWSAAALSYEWVQATPMTSAGAEVLEAFARWAGRERRCDLGQRQYTPAAGLVTLDSAVPLPRRIIGALKVSDLVDDWYDNLATLKNQYTAGRAVWTSATYAVGDVRIPTAGSWYQFRVTGITTGISGATEPEWSEVLDDTTTDGGVTWTCELLARDGKADFADHCTQSRAVEVLGSEPVQVFSVPQIIRTETVSAAEGGAALAAGGRRMALLL